MPRMDRRAGEYHKTLQGPFFTRRARVVVIEATAKCAIRSTTDAAVPQHGGTVRLPYQDGRLADPTRLIRKMAPSIIQSPRRVFCDHRNPSCRPLDHFFDSGQRLWSLSHVAINRGEPSAGIRDKRSRSATIQIARAFVKREKPSQK